MQDGKIEGKINDLKKFLKELQEREPGKPEKKEWKEWQKTEFEMERKRETKSEDDYDKEIYDNEMLRRTRTE